MPFLIVHGTAVWIAVAVAVALGAGVLSRRRARGIAIRNAVLAGGAAVALLYGLGKLAMSRGRIETRKGPLVAFDVGNLDALAIAAALPGSRGAALDELERQLDRHVIRDEAMLASWQALARLRRGCGGELTFLVEQERIGELERLAGECDDAEASAQALVFLGRYAEAARRGGDDLTAIDAHVAIRDWAGVVPLAVSLRNTMAHLPRDSFLVQMHPDAVQQVAPRFACIELYARLRAGEPVAAKLHAAVGGDPFCKVIEAVTLPFDQQAAALDAARDAAPDPLADQTIDALAWAVGAPPMVRAKPDQKRFGFYNLLYAEPHPGEVVRPALMAPHAAAARHDPDGSLAAATMHVWLAEYAYLHGDDAAVQREATIAARSTDPAASWIVETARALLVTQALRTNAPIPEGFDNSVYLRCDEIQLARGDHRFVAANMLPPNDECVTDISSELVAAEHKAIDGDGRPLADLLEHCGVRLVFGIEQMFGLWRRIQTGRERIAAALAVATSDFLGHTSPFDAIRRATVRRDIARLTGDATTAAAWQRVLDRHLAVFADRDVAVALLLWYLV